MSDMVQCRDRTLHSQMRCTFPVYFYNQQTRTKFTRVYVPFCSLLMVLSLNLLQLIGLLSNQHQIKSSRYRQCASRTLYEQEHTTTNTSIKEGCSSFTSFLTGRSPPVNFVPPPDGCLHLCVRVCIRLHSVTYCMIPSYLFTQYQSRSPMPLPTV